MEIPGVNRGGGLDPTMGRGLRQGEGAGIGGNGRMSGRELRDFASEQRRIALDELRAFGDALIRHRQVRERLEADLAHAWTDLLTVILPRLDGGAMGRAWARLRLRPFEAPALARLSQIRQRELREALAALDRDPVLIEAARVCAAMDTKRRNLEARLERLSQQLDLLEAEPLFFKLVAARYDTSDYEGRFWQGRYYLHRRQARELVARHGERLGVRRFRQLYRRYVYEKAAYDHLSLARGALQAREAEVAALARRRHELEDELGSLPEWELAYARAHIRQQLSQPTVAGGLRPLLDDATWGAAASSVLALDARLRGLTGLRVECLEQPRDEAERALTKVEELLAQMRSPARKLDAVHARDEVERSYGLPLVRWRDLRRRHDETAGQPS